MPDWQAAAMRLADDFEELRRVHVAQQPVVEAATALRHAWYAATLDERVLVSIDAPDVSDAIGALVAAVEEGAQTDG